VNTLPPREKSLSTAALAGNAVFSDTYRSLMCGWALREDSDDESKFVDFQKVLPFVLQYNLSKKVLQYS